MAKFFGDTLALIEQLDHGFASLRAFIMDAYSKGLALGKNPDVEKLKRLTREYTSLRNQLSRSLQVVHTFEYNLPTSTGQIARSTTIIQENAYGLTKEELSVYIVRLKSLFRFLVEEAKGIIQ